MSPREQWFHAALLALGPPPRGLNAIDPRRTLAEVNLLKLLDQLALDPAFFYAAVGKAPTQTRDDPVRVGLRYAHTPRWPRINEVSPPHNPESLEFDAWMHLRKLYDAYVNWYGREELRSRSQRKAAKDLA